MTDLTKLNRDQINQAFVNSGYGGPLDNDDDVDFIRFSTDNDAVYVFAFDDGNGRPSLGYLYIKEVDGVLKGEF